MNVADDVAIIWFPVNDLTRSIDFYSGTLGLELTEREEDWAELRAGQTRIGLNRAQSPAGTGGGVLALTPVGGIDAAVEDLADAGVDLTGDGISDHPWGRIANFHDPDENALQLYEPPADRPLAAA